jgi:O-antigen ligase
VPSEYFPRFRKSALIAFLLSNRLFSSVLVLLVIVLVGVASGLELYIVPIAIAGFVVVSLFLVVAIRRPEWALASMIVSIPLQVIQIDLQVTVITLPEALFFLNLLGWFFRTLQTSGRAVFTKSTLNLPVVALCLAYVVSFLRAPDWSVQSYEFGASKTLYKILVGIAIYFVGLRVFRNRQARLMLAYAWLCSGLLAVALGFYYYMSGQYILRGSTVQLTSTLAKAHGPYLVYVVAITIGLLSAAKTLYRRFLLVGATVLFVIQVIMATQRAGWVCLFVVAGAGLILTRKSWVKFSSIAFVLILLAVALSLMVIGLPIFGYPRVATFLSLFSGEDLSVNNRLAIWTYSLEAAKDNPVFGYGLDGFRELYVRGVIWSEIPLGERGIAAHNLLIQEAVTTGLLGVSAVVWLVAAAIWRGFYLLRVVVDPVDRGLLIGALLGVINFVTWGMTDTLFIKLVENNFTFFAILSLLVCIDREYCQRVQNS